METNCRQVALTVLMGSPLFYCALRRKEYPKHCRDCPKLEPRETKEILLELGMSEAEANDFIDGVKKGLQARREGKVVPWEEVKKELGL